MKLERLAYFAVVAVLSDSISSTGDAFAGNKDCEVPQISQSYLGKNPGC